MGYTPVPTKSTGDLWSASDHNTYIRDNFAAGVPDIFTTKGDLAVGTGADAADRLPIGTTGQLLVVDHSTTTGLKWQTDAILGVVENKGDLIVGIAANEADNLPVGSDGDTLIVNSNTTTGLDWHSFAGARYMKGTSQAIAQATFTIINYNTQDWDTISAVTTGAAWKFTCPSGEDGTYLICASAYFNQTSLWNENEQAALRLYKNGAANMYIANQWMHADGDYPVFLSGRGIVQLAATDYIDVRAYQASGASLDINATSIYTHVAIARIL